MSYACVCVLRVVPHLLASVVGCGSGCYTSRSPCVLPVTLTKYSWFVLNPHDNVSTWVAVGTKTIWSTD